MRGAAGAAAPMVSATVGVSSLAVAGLAQWSSYGSVWITWWLGDASGALIVAPLIVSFLRRPGDSRLGGVRELVLLVAAIFVTGALVFAPVIFSVVPAVPLSFAVGPIIVWAGLCYGSRGRRGPCSSSPL
ncbi:MAG TPA: MASE1 domain-containing protein [Candidatus Angelobacter sp.]|nr:MASE1 domain-containing protein [Candidatus Angelobacter sp.]